MSQNRITPPSVKFELHAYGEVYDLTNSIANWKMLEYTLKRDETSGIFHQISFPFEFVLDAYDIVKNIFDKYQYRAKGDMYIYLLKHNWPYETELYHEPHVYNLDWTQYDKSDTKIEIDTKRTSLYDFIKAKNKIVYDIPVREIKEDKPWSFQRINLENIITMRVADDTKRQTAGGKFHRTLGISYEATEVSVKDVIYEKTVPMFTKYEDDMWHTDNDLHFLEINKIEANSKIQLSIDLSVQIKIDKDRGLMREYPILYLTKKYNTSNPSENAIAWKESRKTAEGVGYIRWKENIEVDVANGDRLYLIISYEAVPDLHSITFDYEVDANGIIKASYDARNKEVLIDLINPKTLLQSLVDKMTDSNGKYFSEIEDFNTDKSNLIMMSAAESIRGISTTETNEPKVHTSYRKFVEWMNAYGYEQHVDGNELKFRKRNKGFRSDLIAMELEESECADLREYVDEKRLYSGLKIGYNRKDIENLNVRYEFNGQHDYSTDLSTGENMLELISPYRADCYGIEFLAQERGKDSTDDKSDKDLFLINVSEESQIFSTVYSKLSGNYPNNTIFNANLNPYNLLQLNIDLLGISAKILQFTASDSNSTILIDNQRIDADYEIPNDIGLFEPIIYDIASRNIQNLPSGENVNGLVRFKYKGQVYEGYIDEILKNPAWETETTWILRKRKSAV